MNVDWAGIVFSETVMKRLQHMVHDKFMDDASAEEAMTFVIESLSGNNWEKCRSYAGKSSPETFVFSVSRNLVIDYMRKLSGRPRPPTWLKRKGELWVSLWREHCLRREPLELLVKRHGGDTTREEIVRHILVAIKAKLPWCGVSTAPISIDDDNNSYSINQHEQQRAAGQPYPDEQQHRQDALELAHLLLTDAEDESSSESTAPISYGDIEGITLTPEEKLVLKMHFCDALSISAIAKRLKKSRDQVVRLHELALSKIKKSLTDSGIELDEAHLI